MDDGALTFGFFEYTGGTRGVSNREAALRTVWNLVPKKRLCQADDFSIFDQKRAPGCHAPVFAVIVADDCKLRFHRTLGPVVADLARLDVRAEVFLPVFKPDREA